MSPGLKGGMNKCCIKAQDSHESCVRIFVLCSHQASENGEGHGSQQEQHQDQIQGAPDQLHALSMLSLWR